ncbi:uncharacterized protein LOC115756547 [Rhodamnia argentea]|uniref:Uncharacterized protein LOC115756547 n=1 Tax=Rhodamnia argentea TaxID=178133 RepID=A0A8B8R174_9MYRT|nr:uncharacterized protein LOC115756547 [Rhodamnia argentea]
MEDQSSRKRLRDADDSDDLDFQSAEVKRLRDDLLSFLDDSDPDPGAPDLDSLMRSFQDEIAAAPASSSPSPAAVEVVDLTAESGDSKSELGYLLEASDDELGLPPSTTPSSGEAASCEAELVRAASEASGVSEFWEFEDRISSYGDSFQFGGAGDGYGGGDDEGEYVAFDGLFDYSDAGFDPSDLPGFSWRRGETMPAL